MTSSIVPAPNLINGEFHALVHSMQCFSIPTWYNMFATDLHLGPGTPTLCLQHVSPRALVPQQQKHYSNVKQTASRSNSIKRTRQMAPRAQVQETLTSDGPSVPEILQTKGRRIRVNYIRRDGDYEVY